MLRELDVSRCESLQLKPFLQHTQLLRLSCALKGFLSLLASLPGEASSDETLIIPFIKTQGSVQTFLWSHTHPFGSFVCWHFVVSISRHVPGDVPYIVDVCQLSVRVLGWEFGGVTQLESTLPSSTRS